MRRAVLVLSLAALLAGCGGGGSSSGSASGYQGTFTERTTVAIPAGLAFDPAPSGTATGSLSSAGALRVAVGNGCVLTGIVASDGTVTQGQLDYPGNASGAAGSLPATIAVQQVGNALGVFASVAVQGAASADYTVDLTRG